MADGGYIMCDLWGGGQQLELLGKPVFFKGSRNISDVGAISARA